MMDKTKNDCDGDGNAAPFNAMDCYLHENIHPEPWAFLTPHEAAQLSKMTLHVLGLETLEARKRDRLDFHEVSVWQLRDAVARAYLAGARKEAPT